MRLTFLLLLVCNVAVFAQTRPIVEIDPRQAEFLKLNNDIDKNGGVSIDKALEHAIHMSNLSLCNGGSYMLHVQQGHKYLWNTGDTTNIISVNNSGKYSVVITENDGTITNSTIFVDLSLLKDVVIADSQPFLADNEVIVLDAIPGFKYEWNTGELTPFILVSKPGVYMVTITDENDCSIVSNTLEIMPAIGVDTYFETMKTTGEANKVTDSAEVRATLTSAIGAKGNQ